MRNRTADLLITNQLLYLLSYVGLIRTLAGFSFACFARLRPAGLVKSFKPLSVRTIKSQ